MLPKRATPFWSVLADRSNRETRFSTFIEAPGIAAPLGSVTVISTVPALPVDAWGGSAPNTTHATAAARQICFIIRIHPLLGSLAIGKSAGRRLDGGTAGLYGER